MAPYPEAQVRPTTRALDAAKHARAVALFESTAEGDAVVLQVSRGLGVAVARLERWKERGLAAMDEGSRAR